MRIRGVIFASVSSAFLAASVAAAGSAFAASTNPDVTKAEQAYQALVAGDQATAILTYTQAIESRHLPTEVLANALLNRALAYQQMSSHQEAIDDYTSALQLDAMSGHLRATALYNRGLSQQKLAQPSRAIEDFTSALFLDPEFAQAYYSRGNALRDSGQFLFALSDYDKAVRYKHPDIARVRYAEAQTYHSLKRPKDEKASLEAALAANPSYTAAREQLALLGGAPQQIATLAAPEAATMAAGGELTVRKPDLPPAVAPPSELTAEAPADPMMTAAVDPAPVAKIVDRVPSEATPAAAPADEKILAVEPVDDPAPDEAAAPQVAAVAPEASTEEPAQDSQNAAAEPAGWSVQIASAASESAAWAVWKKMQSKHKTLADQHVVVVKADLGKKGVVYRIRIAGFESQADAKGSCSKLKSGGVSCFIAKSNS
jgi:tetratricopeptide (TPR) repeat protein